MANRGRPRKNQPYKITVQAEPDIRSKGTKTDQDLLDEYIVWLGHLRVAKRNGTPWLAASALLHLSAIEAELGKDRIQDERIRLLEEKLSKIESDQAPPNWVVPVVIATMLFSVLVTVVLFALLNSVF